MVFCPLCNHLANIYLKLQGRNIFKCINGKCSLKFVDPQPSQEKLQELYKKYYYDDTIPPIYGNAEASFFRQLIPLIEEERKGSLHGKFILDFGCGNGTFLEIAKSLGFSVHGLEPDPVARAAAFKKVEVKIYQNLEEILKNSNNTKYDFITMFEVVEHLSEPWKVLSDLKTIMNEKGWLYIQTVDSNSLKATILKSRWAEFINPTHLYFFNENSLSLLMQKSGISNVVRWRPMVSYPAHGIVRKGCQWMLQKLKVDSALRMIGTI